jgi:glycine betaine/choline ABC-type transport system substrate-binding protein
LAEQRASAVVQTVDVFAPLVLARHLRGLQGRFDAVVVMALDHPQVRAALQRLGQRISAADMRAMNHAADSERLDPDEVARRFLDRQR